MTSKKEKTASVDQDKETHCNYVRINKKNKKAIQHLTVSYPF
jgi:hypothetical protein